eukprot:5444511-Pleurochrysis_carterae.AAC.1
MGRVSAADKCLAQMLTASRPDLRSASIRVSTFSESAHDAPSLCELLSPGHLAALWLLRVEIAACGRAGAAMAALSQLQGRRVVCVARGLVRLSAEEAQTPAAAEREGACIDWKRAGATQGFDHNRVKLLLERCASAYAALQNGQSVIERDGGYGSLCAVVGLWMRDLAGQACGPDSRAAMTIERIRRGVRNRYGCMFVAAVMNELALKWRMRDSPALRLATRACACALGRALAEVSSASAVAVAPNVPIANANANAATADAATSLGATSFASADVIDARWLLQSNLIALEMSLGRRSNALIRAKDWLRTAVVAVDAAKVASTTNKLTQSSALCARNARTAADRLSRACASCMQSRAESTLSPDGQAPAGVVVSGGCDENRPLCMKDDLAAVLGSSACVGSPTAVLFWQARALARQRRLLAEGLAYTDCSPFSQQVKKGIFCVQLLGPVMSSHAC